MANLDLIIDPGHGGKDPGAVSQFGHEEDFTLKISLYQYNRFKELGVKVAITRTSDTTLEEDARVAAVKNSGAKYCISNHLNAGGGDRAEVVHSIYDDGKLANKIKDQLLAVGQSSVKVYFRKYGNNDYYYMHRRTGTVSTQIVEYCFIDNAADFNHFNQNWEAYAEAVVKAFCSHIGHPYTIQKNKDGWKQEGGIWYFYKDSVLVKNDWVLHTDKKWYFLKSDGKMAANEWILWKEKWYFLGSDGAMLTGIIEDKGKLYYLQPDGSMLADGRINVSLNVDNSGALKP
jgi:N-acetylmuramoyl-L-alanine amidase